LRHCPEPGTCTVSTAAAQGLRRAGAGRSCHSGGSRPRCTRRRPHRAFSPWPPTLPAVAAAATGRAPRRRDQGEYLRSVVSAAEPLLGNGTYGRLRLGTAAWSGNRIVTIRTWTHRTWPAQDRSMARLRGFALVALVVVAGVLGASWAISKRLGGRDPNPNAPCFDTSQGFGSICVADHGEGAAWWAVAGVAVACAVIAAAVCWMVMRRLSARSAMDSLRTERAW
jgi:hypothetical protein